MRLNHLALPKSQLKWPDGKMDTRPLHALGTGWGKNKLHGVQTSIFFIGTGKFYLKKKEVQLSLKRQKREMEVQTSIYLHFPPKINT